MSAVYGFHPAFADRAPVWWGGPDERHEAATLEGGDLMPVGAGVVLVGMGERTTAQAVGQLARALFERGAAERVIACQMPSARSTMHLDTVFTLCDRDVCTSYVAVAGKLACYSVRPGDWPLGLDIRREERARWSGVPVFNGLTDAFHPTQILADMLTIVEHSELPLREAVLCFLGDVGNNLGDSLMIGAAKLGLEIRLCGPRSLWPDTALADEARAQAAATGARVLLTEELEEGGAGADFLNTDVWVSMGEPEDLWAERIRQLAPYRVDAAAMRLSGRPRVRFMHCLAAFHNAATAVGARITEAHGLEAMEVTEELFESPASIVFDQAENRMHTIKAVLMASLGG